MWLTRVEQKPDPVSTKKMCIITLTRIFHLTYQYPTLVREITTPSLPGFITAALNLVSVKPSSEPVRKLRPNTPFLEIVLYALLELIARHPTTFRPFSAQIHSLLQGIIGSTAPAFPEPLVAVAEQLFIALHNCAPKNTSGDEWKNAAMLTVASIHRASDYVFRGVVEQWESVDPALRQAGAPQNYSQEMGDGGPDPLGLPGWRGIHSGVDRLLTLLRLLSTFLSAPTASAVTIPVGNILDLTSRLTSVVVPSDAGDAQPNLQISREERDILWAELPHIHAACMGLLCNVVSTLEASAFSIAQNILEQATWVFQAEKFSRKVRVSSYDLIRSLISTMGPAMTKQNVSSLSDLLRTCCSDLLPPADNSNPSASSSGDPKAKSKSAQVTANADSFLNVGKQGRETQQRSSFPDLEHATLELLPVVLNSVPTEFIAPSVRAEIDRTIILTADKNAMLASVLNPLPAVKGRGAGSSIIPFLARSHADEIEVEGLIRPRMPVIINTHGVHGHNTVEDDDEEEEEEDENGDGVSGPAYQAATERTGFLKPSSPPTSQTVDSKDTQRQTSPVNKRVHDDQPSTASAGREEGGHAKRARVEKGNPVVPVQPPLDNELPATFTGTPAIPVEKSSVTATPGPQPTETATPLPRPEANSKPASASTGSISAQPKPNTVKPEEGADESDDEMPTLNLESDTDEEEEEEEDDVTMDG